ncbi:hypothetical protein [Polaromonas sp. A23]|uniref:hypothetical protein n=1 Tax=Polaromonas sp. A23 TaxID=1944133 RepID=UPI0009852C6E|nr:hypothetical protein [Polaromonas sp. A23]OOG35866.1 hypothetical protein B0B52_21360 [Polaromonas sp. A23]
MTNIIVDIVLAQTGRFVVWIATFGRWRAERFEEGEAQAYAPEAGLYFKRRGQCVITATGCVLAGFFFYLAFGLLVYALSL